jgi:hypothetical protein
MTLRDRLIKVLRRHGRSTTAPTQAALDEFLDVVRREADGVDLEPEEDPEGAAESSLTATEYIDCPHCGERIGIALDLSGDDQDGIQDCEVCCSPIHITYSVARGRMSGFSARAS